MAGPCSDMLPLTCAASGEPIPWIQTVQNVRGLIAAAPAEARDTLNRQLLLMVDLVRECAHRAGGFRTEIGSAPGGDKAFVWFPFALEHAVVNVATFDRVIEAFKAFRDGDHGAAAAISRDVIRA